jgi:hypothetical protein
VVAAAHHKKTGIRRETADLGDQTAKPAIQVTTGSSSRCEPWRELIEQAMGRFVLHWPISGDPSLAGFEVTIEGRVDTTNRGCGAALSPTH